MKRTALAALPLFLALLAPPALAQDKVGATGMTPAELRAQMNRAVLDYVAAESSITDANAKRLTEQVMKAHAAEAKLFNEHVARVQTVLPARKAARYMQIENKIRVFTEFELASALPLVP